jgi:hypothetical protein
MVDLAVGGGLAWMLFGFALGALDQDAANSLFTLLGRPEGRFIDIFGTVFLAIFPCALVIGFTGSSLGKMIFGVRVTMPDGTPIGMGKALSREFRVWAGGLGLGLPLVNLFALIGSHHRLKKTGATSWDKALSVRVSYRRSSALQWVLNVMGVLLWLACIVGLNVIGRV